MHSTTIPVDQAALAQAFQQRVEACLRLADGADNSADVQVALVLGDLDLAALVRGVLAACANAAPGVRRQWLANFTKFVVLVGNPDKLAHRFGALPVVVEGKVGVVGPAPAAALLGLRRLLRLLDVSSPSEQVGVVVQLDDSAPRAVELMIASACCSQGEFLVTLCHTVAEGQLFGHFAQACELSIRPVATVDSLTAHDVYARVRPASREDASLRLNARLRSVARNSTLSHQVP